MIKLEGTTRR